LIAGEFTTYGLLVEPVAWQIVISVLSPAKATGLKAAATRVATANHPRRRARRWRDRGTVDISMVLPRPRLACLDVTDVPEK
jgi:hypothetical protein